MKWFVPLIVELVCAGLAYAGFRGYGRLVADRADAAGWVRRGLSVGLPVVAAATAVLLDAAGLRASVRTALPGVVGVAGGLTALAVGGYLTILAGYRATLPADAAIRGTDVDTATTTRQFAWFAATVVGTVDVVAVALAVGSWWLPAGVIVALALLFWVFAGVLVARLSHTRPPSTAEHERIQTALDRYATTTGGQVENLELRVLDTDDSGWAGAFVRGPAWRRSVFVASHLLESHAEEGLAAVLAVALGRANRGYFVWKVATVGAAGVGAVAAVGVWRTTPLLGLLLALATVAGYVLGCWWARRCVFAADADALAVTDWQTLVETHRQVAADADTTLDAGRGLRNFLRGRVSRARRLESLPEPPDESVIVDPAEDGRHGD